MHDRRFGYSIHCIIKMLHSLYISIYLDIYYKQISEDFFISTGLWFCGVRNTFSKSLVIFE